MVKKGISESFSLSFKPQWVCSVSGLLTLKNESTKEEYEYELKGVGEEPLAEEPPAAAQQQACVPGGG